MENKQVVLGWWAFLVIISIFNIAFIIIYMLSHKLTDMQKTSLLFCSHFFYRLWHTRHLAYQVC